MPFPKFKRARAGIRIIGRSLKNLSLWEWLVSCVGHPIVGSTLGLVFIAMIVPAHGLVGKITPVGGELVRQIMFSFAGWVYFCTACINVLHLALDEYTLLGKRLRRQLLGDSYFWMFMRYCRDGARLVNIHRRHAGIRMDTAARVLEYALMHEEAHVAALKLPVGTLERDIVSRLRQTQTEMHEAMCDQLGWSYPTPGTRSDSRDGRIDHAIHTLQSLRDTIADAREAERAALAVPNITPSEVAALTSRLNMNALRFPTPMFIGMDLAGEARDRTMLRTEMGLGHRILRSDTPPLQLTDTTTVSVTRTEMEVASEEVRAVTQEMNAAIRENVLRALQGAARAGQIAAAESGRVLHHTGAAEVQTVQVNATPSPQLQNYRRGETVFEMEPPSAELEQEYRELLRRVGVPNEMIDEESLQEAAAIASQPVTYMAMMDERTASRGARLERMENGNVAFYATETSFSTEPTASPGDNTDTAWPLYHIVTRVNEFNDARMLVEVAARVQYVEANAETEMREGWRVRGHAAVLFDTAAMAEAQAVADIRTEGTQYSIAEVGDDRAIPPWVDTQLEADNLLADWRRSAPYVTLVADPNSDTSFMACVSGIPTVEVPRRFSFRSEAVTFACEQINEAQRQGWNETIRIRRLGSGWMLTSNTVALTGSTFRSYNEAAQAMGRILQDLTTRGQPWWERDEEEQEAELPTAAEAREEEMRANSQDRRCDVCMNDIQIAAVDHESWCSNAPRITGSDAAPSAVPILPPRQAIPDVQGTVTGQPLFFVQQLDNEYRQYAVLKHTPSGTPAMQRVFRTRHEANDHCIALNAERPEGFAMPGRSDAPYSVFFLNGHWVALDGQGNAEGHYATQQLADAAVHRMKNAPEESEIIEPEFKWEQYTLQMEGNTHTRTTLRRGNAKDWEVHGAGTNVSRYRTYSAALGTFKAMRQAWLAICLRHAFFFLPEVWLDDEAGEWRIQMLYEVKSTADDREALGFYVDACDYWLQVTGDCLPRVSVQSQTSFAGIVKHVQDLRDGMRGCYDANQRLNKMQVHMNSDGKLVPGNAPPSRRKMKFT